jgi:predicted ABC-type exoprotein transport system permease subunit
MITEGIFFSVNYIMNAKNLTNNQHDKRLDTNQIIEMEKSTKQELYKQYQSFVRTPKIVKKGNNRRSSLVVEVSG